MKKQRENRKRALRMDIIRQIKKHLEWETIGIKEGTEITRDEIKEVLQELLHKRT